MSKKKKNEKQKKLREESAFQKHENQFCLSSDAQTWQLWQLFEIPAEPTADKKDKGKQ